MRRNHRRFLTALLLVSSLLPACRTFGGSAELELTGAPVEAFEGARLVDIAAGVATIEWVEDRGPGWSAWRVTVDDRDGYQVRASYYNDDDGEEIAWFEVRVDEGDDGERAATVSMYWVADESLLDDEDPDYLRPTVSVESGELACSAELSAGRLAGSAECTIQTLLLNDEPVDVELQLSVSWDGAGRPSRPSNAG